MPKWKPLPIIPKVSLPGEAGENFTVCSPPSPQSDHDRNHRRWFQPSVQLVAGSFGARRAFLRVGGRAAEHNLRRKQCSQSTRRPRTCARLSAWSSRCLTQLMWSGCLASRFASHRMSSRMKAVTDGVPRGASKYRPFSTIFGGCVCAFTSGRSRRRRAGGGMSFVPQEFRLVFSGCGPPTPGTCLPPMRAAEWASSTFRGAIDGGAH